MALPLLLLRLNISEMTGPSVPNPRAANGDPANVIAPTVVGYARVSTDLQREKESIRTQIECIEAECRKRGWRLGEVYCDDGVSGTLPLEARPAGARLLRDARAGQFKSLVVYKSDRIGRDVLVNEMAARLLHDEVGHRGAWRGRKHRAGHTDWAGDVHLPERHPARLDAKNTLRRSRDATHRLAREGTWLGGMCPTAIASKEKTARPDLCFRPRWTSAAE